MIERLLIANRGEIACRIIATARRMGIATVAVYSDADAHALHVQQADMAVRIGPAPAAQSYLDIAAIIEAARRSGADAVHPGYGFLSENAAFAAACAAADLTFVGPPPSAIEAMGDKARAKALMRAAAVPVVPGYDGDDQSLERLAREAEAIGFPLLVKAAAGGGGRGMRRITQAGELAEALESARREALSAFGDDRLLLERLIEDARHIEVQVFADRHGNVIHLGERDCSLQRRHQKIVEEAPSPFVGQPLRDALGKAAVEAARTVSYVGAGTVEFVVGADGAFHFLEMNTRLQVEHPVTEAVTGLDLVEWQLRVARGERLPLAQHEVGMSGHAVEARLYAEDVPAGFLPQSGVLARWRPQLCTGLRVDHGSMEGHQISPFYDPMIAKVIAHAPTRQEAIAKLRHGLEQLPVFGIATNRDFLIAALSSDAFAAGEATTTLVDRWVAQGASIVEGRAPDSFDFVLAALFAALCEGGDWFSTSGMRSCPIMLRSGADERRCVVEFERGRAIRVSVEGDLVQVDRAELDGEWLGWSIAGREGRTRALRDGPAIWLDHDGTISRFVEPDPLAGARGRTDDGRVLAPVSGLLRELGVDEGDVVAAGASLGVIEAMKMETRLVAPMEGTVVTVSGRAGAQVAAGDCIIVIEPADAPAA